MWYKGKKRKPHYSGLNIFKQHEEMQHIKWLEKLN